MTGFARWGAYGIAAVVAVPVVVIVAAWLLPVPADLWPHLAETVLPRVLANTVLLLAGVLTGTFLLGVSLAWLTAMTDLPGRRFLSWALLAPMAMPAYVLGFVYCGLLEFAGPAQTGLRAVLGEGFRAFPEIRSAGGVIFVMTLALYPYVYMISRAAFVTQGVKAMEAGRSLGCSPRAAFFRVALPMARPWILGALTLVAMEALADFGTVSMFVYETFTTAIYKAWYGFFSPAGAAQLASLLVIFVFALLWAKHALERRKRFVSLGRPAQRAARLRLGRTKAPAAAFAWGVFALAFVVPVAQLLVWAARTLSSADERLFALVVHSLVLGAVTAAVACAAALVLTMAQRGGGKPVRLAAQVASLGYALPGSVLAVGVFLPLVWVDHRLAGFAERMLGRDVGLLLTGSLFAMVLGLAARFLAVSLTSIGSGAARIPPSLDEAAATFGVRGWQAVKRVHLPLLSPAIVAGAMLVFVDVVKEMPLTLMTRPFGWDTLSVRIFELTSEGEWQKAALPATVLLLTGLIPIAWLSREERVGAGR